MIKKSLKSSEFDNFTSFAKDWWDPFGNYKILHTLTPLRIKYIKSIFRDYCPKLKKTNKFFYNLDILDLGCGGGLICEPLARLGANITGIDFIKDAAGCHN